MAMATSNFVCNYDGANRLVAQRRHGGNFTDVAAKARLNFAGPSHSPYFAISMATATSISICSRTGSLPVGRPRGGFGTRAGWKAAGQTGRAVFPSYAAGTPRSREGAAAEVKQLTPFLLDYGHEDRLYRNDGPDTMACRNSRT